MVGMQDAIKMINNPEKQLLATRWGRQAGEDSYCLSLALQRGLTRYRHGVLRFRILPGSSGQGRKIIGKPIFRTWVFLCLSRWRVEAPAVRDNEVEEDFSGWWAEKAIAIWFKFRLCLALLVMDRRK